MIQKFICWLFGHKRKTFEETSKWDSSYNKKEGTSYCINSTTKTPIKAKFCERCGCKL